MIAEEWRLVPGFPDYRVSSLGRVESRRASKGKCWRPMQTSRPSSSRGYVQVNLRADGATLPTEVHRLVAAVFLGPRPKGMDVCHGDGNKTNNAVTNLRYDTRSANLRDAVAHGAHAMTKRTHCPSGHPYESSAYVWRGKRICRSCHTERARQYRAKKRAEVAA